MTDPKAQAMQEKAREWIQRECDPFLEMDSIDYRRRYSEWLDGMTTSLTALLLSVVKKRDDDVRRVVEEECPPSGRIAGEILRRLFPGEKT